MNVHIQWLHKSMQVINNAPCLPNHFSLFSLTKKSLFLHSGTRRRGGWLWELAAVLGVYNIIGAGRNIFTAIIICSLASDERGIIFFTVSCVTELLGLLEDAEHLGHIVRDCDTSRKWTFLAVIFCSLHTHTHRPILVFFFFLVHGQSSSHKGSAERLRHYLINVLLDANQRKCRVYITLCSLKKLYVFLIEDIIHTARSVSSRKATHYLFC